MLVAWRQEASSALGGKGAAQGGQQPRGASGWCRLPGGTGPDCRCVLGAGYRIKPQITRHRVTTRNPPLRNAGGSVNHPL